MDPSKSVQSLPELRSAAVERADFVSLGKSLSTTTGRKTVVMTSTFCNGGLTPNTTCTKEEMEQNKCNQSGDAEAWNVDHLAALPTLPSTSFRMFIGRSSLATTVPLSVVLSRIESFLRLESIASTINYDTVQIDCVTFHMLHFSVHLWQGIDCEDNQIVVEMRRLHGCSIEMQRTRQALFQYVTTGTREELEEGQLQQHREHFNASKSRCTLTNLKPICAIVKKICSSGNNNARIVAIMNSKQQSCRQGMTKCEDLLGNHHDDQKRLGMESLVQLTDPSAASTETADTVTRAIVFGTTECAERLREDLMYYIRSASSGGSESTLLMSEENDLEIFEYDERHNTAVMRTLALRVLANSLEREAKRTHNNERNDKGNDDDSNKTPLFQMTYWWELLDSLLFIMRDASLHPHDAAMAAKCIRLLDEISVSTNLSTQFTFSFLKHLIAANAYGKAHHLNLEIESQRLMDRVSNCI